MTHYTIIIPIHDAYELAKRCIESVLRNTPKEHRLVLVDDGSTDPRIKELREWSTLMWIHHETALGFVKSVNEAIERDGSLVSNGITGFGSPRDVIILNSDTEVPPRWVERLDVCNNPMRGALGVAAVCPLSNYATIFSVPNAGNNNVPPWLTTEQMDRIVEETSSRSRPVVPVVMGFCMLMTRDAINNVGLLDEAFGLGYGEEVDWCLRARAAGFCCVLADDLFVFHKGHASFGDGESALKERYQGENLIRKRWPEYVQEVQNWWFDSMLREHKTRIADRLRPRRIGSKKKLKVLHVLHRPIASLGGTEIATRRLIEALANDVESSVIYPIRGGFPSDGHIGSDADGNLIIEVNQELTGAHVTTKNYPLGHRAPNIELFFERTLRALQPDIVHIQHTIGWGTVELPRIAARLGCKVVLEAHDEYLNCPVLKLGGACSKPRCDTGDECHQCVKSQIDWVSPNIDVSVDDYVRTALEAWAGEPEADAFISPAASIGDSAFRDKMFYVIPHGRPVRVMQPQGLRAGKHIAFVGVGAPEKGWDCFQQAAIELLGSGVDISVIGFVDGTCSRAGLDHVRFVGGYEHQSLATYLATVDIAVPACARHEAYGLVLDECAGAGCKLAVPDLPALDRFNSVPGVAWYRWGEPETLLRSIRALQESPVDPVDIWASIPTTTDCARKTLEVYWEVMSHERRHTEENTGNSSGAPNDRPLRDVLATD